MNARHHRVDNGTNNGTNRGDLHGAALGVAGVIILSYATNFHSGRVETYRKIFSR